MTSLHLVLLAVAVASGPERTADEQLAKLEAVGRAIHLKDRAAWLATDRLVEATGGVPPGIRGWVTLPVDDDWRVRFVQHDDDGVCSRLSVLVGDDGAGPLERAGTCEPLAPAGRAMFAARQAAFGAMTAGCSERYNTVVLPHDGEDAAWVVYLLAATQEVGKVVVGGHVRVLVGGDGTEVVAFERLSKSCLTLDAVDPEAGTAEALVVTHVLDDHPIETHVFLGLLHDVKLYVITDGVLWSVSAGEIERLLDGEEFEAYMKEAEAAYEEAAGTP